MPKPECEKPERPANRRVAICAYNGLCTFEFGIAVEAFCLPRPEFDDWYEARVCAVEPGPLRAMGGIHISADCSLDGLRGAGTIVVPGWRGITPEVGVQHDEEPPAALIGALREAYQDGARLMSICSGVFVLAATGLLAGKQATTHWRYAGALAQAFPDIRVNPDVLYIEDGRLFTSAGSAAGLDLCLHLIARDFGSKVANQVARRLVVPPHRSGGQAQFVERPVQDRGSRLAALLDWLRKNLDQNISVAAMAKKACMSQRTFERRFFSATGTSPGQWLTGHRIDFARELLETGTLSVEDVATRCGFGSADTLRHHFRKQFRVSPLQYRRSFSPPDRSRGAAGG